jgi:periplasmic protein TonB
LARIRKTNDRPFWAALACAALLHAVLILGAGSANPRHMGEADGQLDAISVDFVEPEVMAGDAAGPKGDTHAQEQAQGQDTSTSALQVPRPATAAWQAETAPEKPAEKAPDKPAEKAPEKPKAPSIEEKPQQQAMFQLPDPDTQKNDTQQKSETQKGQKENQKESPKESQKSAATKTPATKDKPSQQLDLSLPSSLFKAPSGGAGDYSSAMVRPPGITRSGENDDFGRDVVKALRKTMPPHQKIFGRVTVRIVLSPNGDLVELQMVKGSGDTILDQTVMFAVRQSVFPFPPKGSTILDRTFMVSYIYS